MARLAQGTDAQDRGRARAAGLDFDAPRRLRVLRAMSSGVAAQAPAAARPAPAAARGARALWAVALVLIATYLVSGPRTLPDADAGEFAAVAVAGGIPHPPGYPLLTVILQGFAHLSGLLGLIPALTLPSTLAAVAAALIVCRTLLDRDQPAFEAAVATLAVFLSCNVWRAATTIEPFAINLLQAASLLWVCNAIARAPERADSAPHLTLIGANFGLAVCNHHSLITLAPLPLAALWPVRHGWPRRGALLALSFALGLSPLAFFWFLREQHGWIWGDWDRFLPQLIHHLLRSEYGSLSLAASTRGGIADGPLRMFGTLPRVLSFVFALCLGLGCWVALRARLRVAPGGERDRFAIGLCGSFVLSAVCFPALFVIADDPVANVIVDRFLSLPIPLLAFPIATGLRYVRWPSRALGYAGGAALVALHLAQQWPAAERRSHRIFEDHVRNVFALAPRGAAVMSVSDAGFSGGLFGKYALGRRDVVLIFSGFNNDWYAARLGKALGITAAGGAGGRPPARPLYVLEVPDSSAALPAYPVGPLLRVLAPGEPMPSAREQFARNRAATARLRLPTPAQLRSADAWELDVLREYRDNWALIAERLRREGDGADARAALGFRDALAPRD
jgi:hypothetical protein